MPPHDRRALIDQLRALLTQQRYNPIVIHNQCRNAEHFLEYLARRDVAVEEQRRITYPLICATRAGGEVLRFPPDGPEESLAAKTPRASRCSPAI